MSEEQKHSKNSQSEPKASQHKLKLSRWKAFFRKKWTFPAIYMGVAALILALIMWYQDPGDFVIPNDEVNPDVTYENTGENGSQAAGEMAETPEAVPVNQSGEKMEWPFKEDINADVVMNFYNENASDDIKAASLVKYEDSYWPHQGIDFALPDDKSFEVTAALSGKVVRAEKDPLMGFVVEIEHDNGLTTLYQSLANSSVSVGDEVKKGQVIGMAGRNLFEKEAGVHLHFEVRQDGKPVSPDKYLSTQKTDTSSAQ
ncbi:MAG: M23 family metallopeptidase [Bacillaceae bacterium]|nr:M23 family metallopeptidase [Bacillaceae bacterium]